MALEPMLGHGNWAALSAVSSGRTETFQRVLISDPTTPSQHLAVGSTGALYTSATFSTPTNLLNAPLGAIVATSAVIPLSATFKAYIYGIGIFPEPILISASTVKGWWKLQSSGVSGDVDITGFAHIGKVGVGTDTFSQNIQMVVNPPSYLLVAATNSAVAFVISAVSAGAYGFGGWLSYWYA